MPTPKNTPALYFDPARILPGQRPLPPASRFLCVVLVSILGLAGAIPISADEGKALQITRPVHSWEFLCALGKRAGIFGNESGNVEAWVYPLKLFRSFSLRIHTDGLEIPAAKLARTITVRPESVTIVYAGDTYSIQETFFVPVDEPGAIIQFDVETEKPLEIEAIFQRDFQLEWPAAAGGTYINWDENLHAFVFGEESKRLAGLVGSPSAAVTAKEFDTNYASSEMSAFRLGVTTKGKETKVIAISGSIKGQVEAEATYRKLTATSAALQKESAEYYANYLRNTVSVELPDAQIQAAYDWSRISVLQGLVTNPTLGTGLVAGYRTSGQGQRPGFAWFFGRDAFWTTFALDSEGDFANSRQALNFIIQFQREDGRIPHEIAQGASFVNWFKDYPYGFASADATPLYIIAMNEYVTASGDSNFAKDNWASIWKAYEFLCFTYDGGFPKNLGVGHGWIEGGPLLPVKSELYQSALAVEALKALSTLCERVGKNAEGKRLAEESARQTAQLNDAFWSPEKKYFAYALDTNGKRVDELSVLAAVPMWFGLLESEKAKATTEQLASGKHATDWGMRIISNQSSLYSAGGYHFGSVWPLFTGWAAVGGYRYHQVHPAYQNLRANALLASTGSPGHVTEVLSGDFYQPISTSSPHQIWSAAMVISPILRGMLGLKTDAATQTITLAPSLPAEWDSFAIRNIQAGNVKADVSFRRSSDEIAIDVRRTGKGDCVMDLQPAVSLRAKVMSVELNGRPLAYRVEANDSDQQVMTKFTAYGGPSLLRIRLRNDFAVSYAQQPPPYGYASVGLRIVSESWSPNRDRLTLEVEGLAGHFYELSVLNAGQIAKIEGAELLKKSEVPRKVRITLPGRNQEEPVKGAVVFYLSAEAPAGRSKP